MTHIGRWAALAVAYAGINGAVAVAAAAYATHGVADPHAAGQVVTASLQQLFHALAIVALAALAPRWPGKVSRRLGQIAMLAFAIGLTLFAYAVYATALLGRPATLAPTGGTMLIFGWLILGIAGLAAMGARR